MATLVTANTATGGISIAYDYTQELAAITSALAAPTSNDITLTTATVRIADSLSQIAFNSNSIVSNLVGINSSLNRLATSIEALTTLSTGTGIRINDPSAYTTLIDLYDWYITQENPLETSSFTSTEFVNFVQAVSSITNYMPRFK